MFEAKAKKRIAIFASGTGSNALKIIEHFASHPDIEVSLIISNKKNAGVLDIAKEHHIESWVIKRSEFYDSDSISKELEKAKIDLLVLAGFLWLIPSHLVKHFPRKIINIHPALLPKYGGKGMYGMHVHRAVKEAGEKESGISIHFVNEKYDEGQIIFQKEVSIDEEDSAEDIRNKVLALEHRYFAQIVERVLS